MRFRDYLALIMVAGIPGMVVAGAVLNLSYPESAVGAFIVGWTLSVQFYFRKAEPKA